MTLEKFYLVYISTCSLQITVSPMYTDLAIFFNQFARQTNVLIDMDFLHFSFFNDESLTLE